MPGIFVITMMHKDITPLHQDLLAETPVMKLVDPRMVALRKETMSHTHHGNLWAQLERLSQITLDIQMRCAPVRRTDIRMVMAILTMNGLG